MSLRRAVPAGLVDTSCASLATFAIGLYTVRVFDPASLGAYALVFSAFTTLMEVSARLVFLSAEIDAVKREDSARLGMLGQSLRQGAVFAVAAGLAIGTVMWAFPAEIERDVAIALVLTAAPCTMISPVQDHVRKMLHIGGRSWDAAWVSGVQLVVAVFAIAVLSAVAVPVAWHPFGALTTANVVSAAFALGRWRAVKGNTHGDLSSLGALLRSGRWHLLGGFTPHVAGFAALALVAHLAGAPAAGFAEAARILARPIAVLSQGIRAVIGPPLMRAAHLGDRDGSRRLTWLYIMLVGGGGTLYTVGAGFEWFLNPFAYLVPNAYVVPGLAAMTIGVYVVDRVAGAGAGLQLLGAGRERALAVILSVSAIGRLLGGATAPVTGAFAVPIGDLILSLIRRPWLMVAVRRVYTGRVHEGGVSARGENGSRAPLSEDRRLDSTEL